MGYYRGDFYRGYRGDPGFFSFLGGVARSFLGLPAAATPITTAISKVAANPIVAKVVKTVGQHPVLTAAGGAGLGGVAAGAAGAKLMSRGSPSAAGLASAGAMRGGGGRRRRMNPCNPRALRRAIRRTHSFARLAMKTIRLVHPQKKAKFGGFRKRKAKK